MADTSGSSMRACVRATFFTLSDFGCAMLFRFWEGIYVLYTYAAKRTTSQKVQKHLSTPIVGGEANVLRHMTFRTS